MELFLSASVWVPISKKALLQPLTATPLLCGGHVFDSNSSAIVFFLSLLSEKDPYTVFERQDLRSVTLF